MLFLNPSMVRIIHECITYVHCKLDFIVIYYGVFQHRSMIWCVMSSVEINVPLEPMEYENTGTLLSKQNYGGTKIPMIFIFGASLKNIWDFMKIYKNTFDNGLSILLCFISQNMFRVLWDLSRHSICPTCQVRVVRFPQ